MSFLDHVRACNRHDLARYRRFEIDGARLGWVAADALSALADYAGVFEVSETAVALDARLGGFADRSAACAAAARDLVNRGVIRKWRDEDFPVKTAFEAPALMVLDRGAVPFFGVRAWGLHVNGFTRADDGSLMMWIGRRDKDAYIAPGALDNLIAGGQPHGLGLEENLVKEAGEEAAVPPDLARTARPVGHISYLLETEEGIKPDTMFCYDLELPPDFTPRNTDGEITEFYRLPAEEVARIVSSGFEFKFNCNLVVIDFLIRHGVIGPDHPEHDALLAGLRAGDAAP